MIIKIQVYYSIFVVFSIFSVEFQEYVMTLFHEMQKKNILKNKLLPAIGAGKSNELPINLMWH